jgi:hypothetical protein
LIVISKTVLLVLAVTVSALTLCSPTSARDEPEDVTQAEELQQVSFGLESDYNPRYVWRGLAFSEGAVAQTSLWATRAGTTYSLWTNSSLDRADGHQTNEIDFTVSWERSWRGMDLEPSLQIYTYPNQQDAPSTGEAGLKFSRPLGPLTVFAANTVDLREYRGAYFGELGLGLTKELTSRAELESSVSFGLASAKFNEAYVGPAKSAFNVAQFELSLTWRGRGGSYVRPHISVTRIMDRELRDAVTDPSLTNLGLALGMEF